MFSFISLGWANVYPPYCTFNASTCTFDASTCTFDASPCTFVALTCTFVALTCTFVASLCTFDASACTFNASTFIFAALDGTDTITDFNDGLDYIGLSGGLTFGQLSFSGSNIIVTSSNQILATLTGINTTTLTSADFLTV